MTAAAATNLSLVPIQVQQVVRRTQTGMDYPQLEKRFDSWLKKQKKTA